MTIRDKEKIYKFGERYSGTKTISGQPQDYACLLEKCLARKELFQDPEFPCKDSTLFGSKPASEKIFWKRPGEIAECPEFFKGGFSRFDVNQGEIGNCWMVASTAILTLYKDLFERVVPGDQTFEEGKYAGIFHFVLWKDNRWVDVVVDDRLAVNSDDKLMSISSNTEGEFWSALLEKAYAKLHGGYAALIGGSGIEAMVTYTGGISEQILLTKPPKNLYNIILKAFQRNSLLTCSILSEEKGEKGLIALHEYSITDVRKITVEGGDEIEMLRLRNPWGSSEWRGAWGDKSSQWKALSAEAKSELGLIRRDDGEFWMCMEDFLKYFELLDFCHLAPGSLTGEMASDSTKKKWEVSTFEGSWVPGASAGGCPEDMEKFAMNPQYMVTMHEPDDDNEDGECTIVVALLQKDRRVFEVKEDMWLNIGFNIYEVEDPENCPKPLTAEYLQDNTIVGDSEGGEPSREITKRFRFLPGTFCVIPCTLEPDQAGDFLLRIYTEKKSFTREHDETVCIIGKSPDKDGKCVTGPDQTDGDASDEKEGEATDENKEEEEEEEEEEEIDEDVQLAFKEVAGEEDAVDCWGLQKLLNKMFETEGKAQDFSLDLCRSMVALIDDDFTGELTLQEFAILHKFLKIWEEAFKENDKDSCGFLSTYELRKALRSAGYSVNQHVLKGLVLRYGHKRRIAFQDFIACAVKLMCMIEIYDQIDEDNENVIELTRNEWLKYTMYC